MKERPILFNAEMVRAILEGRKTQTRRVLKKQPVWKNSDNPMISDGWAYKDQKGRFSLESFPDNLNFAQAFLELVACPFGQVGDRLWVRETFCTGIIEEHDASEPGDRYLYVDDSDYGDGKQYPIYKQMVLNEGIDFDEVKWKPSIHMPRSASRILLEITNIRVERLNDISEADAIDEGIKSRVTAVPPYDSIYQIPDNTSYYYTAKQAFSQLWESINGEDSWSANPWVWVVEFKVVGGDAL